MSLFPKAIIAGVLTGVLGLVLLVGLDFLGVDSLRQRETAAE